MAILFHSLKQKGGASEIEIRENSVRNLKTGQGEQHGPTVICLPGGSNLSVRHGSETTSETAARAGDTEERATPAHIRQSQMCVQERQRQIESGVAMRVQETSADQGNQSQR